MRPPVLRQTSNKTRPASVCLSDSSPFYSVFKFIQVLLSHLLGVFPMFMDVYFENVVIICLFNIQYSLEVILPLKGCLEQLSWLSPWVFLHSSEDRYIFVFQHTDTVNVPLNIYQRIQWSSRRSC